MATTKKTCKLCDKNVTNSKSYQKYQYCWTNKWRTNKKGISVHVHVKLCLLFCRTLLERPV